jgi:hypothetical protein
MRHDAGAETGDNLTLDEWLKAGKASGRGLKLDVKEPEHMDAIVRAVKAANIPSERLMWNLQDGAMGAWAAALRRDFPRSTLAINPTGGAESDAKITSSEVARMLALAKRGGAPIAFVVRYDRLTDSAIRALKSAGVVSVWNHVGRAGVSRDNIAQLTADLRARGVDGVVDLQPSYNLVDKIEYKLDQGKNAVGELVHDAFDKLRRN